MNYYEIWANLAPGTDDMEFVRCVRAYLDHLVSEGDLDSYSIRRRKLGFGPEGLGEFNLTLRFRGLAQLDEAFFDVSKRSGETERLHHEVYSKVTGFKAALYRDFPDAVREA